MDGVCVEPVPLVKETESTIGHFWYSRLSAGMALAFFLLIVEAISCLIPPLQSPDEEAHLARAYLLAKGEIFLRTRDGVTGGEIDTGLLDYMAVFQSLPFQFERKIGRTDFRSARRIVWSGKRKFTSLSNTALYFPLPYMPQAVAFAVGEQAGLSISDSYYLARLLSLTTTLGMFLVALMVYPVPLIACSLPITPMAIFQLGSASLDAVTFGAAGVAAALFMRGTDTRYSFESWMHVSLLVCLFILATCRVCFISLTPLPAVLYIVRHSRAYLVSATGLTVLSLGWIGFALKSVEGMPNVGLSTTELALYYVAHPLTFFLVLFNTISNGQTLESYWTMFVGVLGWLDTPLDSFIYATFAAALTVLAVLSFERDRRSLFELGRLSLSVGAILALLFMFFIELVTWTPHPAKAIEGIQGRYFIPIVILVSYSTFGRRLRLSELRACLAIVFLMTLFSIAELGEKLLNRYWIN